MAIIPKTTTQITKQRKDESSKSEGIYLDGLFRYSVNLLIERVKNKEIVLLPKEIAILHQLRTSLNVEQIENASAFFETCDNCQFMTSCSLYKEGEECKYNLSKELSDSSDVLQVMLKLLQIEGDRIQRSLLIEKMEGIVDRDVSAEMMQYFDMVNRLKEAMTEEESLTVKRKKTGAISTLFGDIIDKAKSKEIEAECIVEEDVVPQKPKEMSHKVSCDSEVSHKVKEDPNGD